MLSKKIKCLYRNCQNTIDENINGNTKYCPEIKGFISCYNKKKKIRERERIKKNKEKLIKESRLSELITNTVFFQEDQNLTFEIFHRLFSPYFDLFEIKTINSSTCYFFQNTSFFKVLIGNEEFITIDSSNNI